MNSLRHIKRLLRYWAIAALALIAGFVGVGIAAICLSNH